MRVKARFSAMRPREQAHSPQATSYRLQSALYWPHGAQKPGPLDGCDGACPDIFGEFSLFTGDRHDDLS
jgi:hypothetical protein